MLDDKALLIQKPLIIFADFDDIWEKACALGEKHTPYVRKM